MEYSYKPSRAYGDSQGVTNLTAWNITDVFFVSYQVFSAQILAQVVMCVDKWTKYKHKEKDKYDYVYWRTFFPKCKHTSKDLFRHFIEIIDMKSEFKFTPIIDYKFNKDVARLIQRYH